MTIITLPLNSSVAQRFVTQLGDTKYQFDIRFNDRSRVWSMSITDDASSTLLVSGIAILLGQNLLAPFNLKMGALMVYDESNSGIDAGANDLGSRVNVYWFSQDLLP